MRIRNLYRLLLVALAGGMMFQSASCSSQLMTTVAASVLDAFSTVLSEQLNLYVSQALGTTG
jgi:hypothetical protein